jgi:hypothetical protein
MIWPLAARKRSTTSFVISSSIWSMSSVPAAVRVTRFSDASSATCASASRFASRNARIIVDRYRSSIAPTQMQ